MKKLFAIILSAMLILTMCTVTAFAIDQNVTLDEIDGRLEITEAGSYTLTGTLQGTVYVDPGEGDVELILDGADIYGGDQPGIIAESGDSLTINLPEGSINRISGNAGNLYSATIYSTIDTAFEGDGALYVISDSTDGIAAENADLTFDGGSYAITAEDNAITATGYQPGELTVNDGHFSTDATNNVDPKAIFTMNGGEFFEPLPESFNMNQSSQQMNGNMPSGQQPQMNGNMPSGQQPQMNGNMPSGQQPQMNGNMPNGQQNASSSGSASEVVSGTMTNSAADLEADYDNATYITVSDDNSDIKITSSGTYVVSGTSSDGNITVKKGTTGVVLVLDDLDLTSTTGATVSINKEAEVKVIISGDVVLTDNENPDDEYSTDADVADAYDGAALKAKANSQVYVTGDGTLTINGNAKNGIKAGDDSSLIFDDVTVNITATNDGINGNYDVTLLSGTFNISAGDDAIHADHILTIGSEDGTGPTVKVTKSGEGMEGTVVNVLGGDISIVSSDDAINAANGDGIYEGELDYSFNMLGGKVVINSSGDGIDSNGNVNLIGGSAQVNSAAGGGEAGIDYDGQYYISDQFNLNNRSGISGADMMPGQMGGMNGQMPGQINGQQSFNQNGNQNMNNQQSTTQNGNQSMNGTQPNMNNNRR
ncbi:carbohydrate-binding domain-containing protein [uncultured Ruminococcus sp.]|uniref:carbohydrate-binding domain-containing protein n=1 Tax=uncultured Ruminococcus sp. TaxID=165186 RepID=UPI00292E6FF2|nr:carbohydrate-binding domain-containing protein [uncultured Ruminococcus sp.]